MSPLGDEYRTRIRQFPSLINNTTISWFFPWPEDALSSVARKLMAAEAEQVHPRLALALALALTLPLTSAESLIPTLTLALTPGPHPWPSPLALGLARWSRASSTASWRCARPCTRQ